MNEKTQIGRTSYKYSDIIGLFVQNMKKIAELEKNTVFENVVVGRPVHFVDNNEDADKRAESELEKIFKAQGFKKVSFEFEPIAAAHDYEYRLQREETCLVFDIGGGTSDFSIIELGPDRKKEMDRKKHILATSGLHIGGNDFDRRLNLKLVMPEMGLGTQSIDGLPLPSSVYYSLATWHEIHSLYNRSNKTVIKNLFQMAARKDLVSRLVTTIDKQYGHKLAGTVEQGKINCSDGKNDNLNLNYIEQDWGVQMGKESVSQALDDLLDKIIQAAIDTVVIEAGLTPNDIDSVYMTGGSSSLEMLESKLKTTFPLSKIVSEDKFSSVARGLAITAQSRYGNLTL